MQAGGPGPGERARAIWLDRGALVRQGLFGMTRTARRWLCSNSSGGTWPALGPSGVLGYGASTRRSPCSVRQALARRSFDLSGRRWFMRGRSWLPVNAALALVLALG